MASDEEFGDEPVFPPKSAGGAFRVSQVDWDEAFVKSRAKSDSMGTSVEGLRESQGARKRGGKPRGQKAKARESNRAPITVISGQPNEPAEDGGGSDPEMYLGESARPDSSHMMHDWINASFEALDDDVMQSIDNDEDDQDASLYDLLVWRPRLLD